MSSLYRTIREQLYLIVLKAITILVNIVPFHWAKRIIVHPLGFRLGKGSAIHGGLKIFGFKPVIIGDYTTINSGCYIDNRKPITIGSCVNISHDARIYTLGHDINDPHFSIKGAPVTIGDYACIFENAMIMPGVTIGKGAVVYPGAVVTKDVEEYCVVGGNPAKIIRKRNTDLRYKHTYKYWFVI
jgi:acetyltransferase-like isoleucine patch superfamily enzyme